MNAVCFESLRKKIFNFQVEAFREEVCWRWWHVGWVEKNNVHNKLTNATIATTIGLKEAEKASCLTNEQTNKQTKKRNKKQKWGGEWKVFVTWRYLCNYWRRNVCCNATTNERIKENISQQQQQLHVSTTTTTTICCNKL